MWDAPPTADVEAQARLRRVGDVLEHEGQALAALNDPRLDDVLHAIEETRAAITIALAMLGDPPSNGR